MSQASPIKRRKSRQIMVGTVPVGGDAPISVQSMTNTETRDVDATLAQITAIADAGADIVRVSVPSMDAAEAFKLIRQQSPVPLVADIHFDHKIALKVAEYGVDCLRINPGNIGKEQKVREVIAACKDKGIPIRIGVNAGSLGKELMRKYPEPTSEALIESALKNVDILDRHNFPDFKVSVKASEVFMAVAAYRGLAQQIEQPLHLGITEAGALRGGTVKSAVVACPSCSRQNFDVIGTMNELERRLEDIRTPMDVAVIGCIVNGPGEAKEADVGLTGATPSNLIYLDGEPDHKVSNTDFVDHLESVIRKRAENLEAQRAREEAEIISSSH